MTESGAEAAAPAPAGRKTDEELALEAKAGSRPSFDELAFRYKRRLFVFLRPRLGCDQDAEDMVQETFLKLYRNIGKYDPAFRFSTWLYTAAGRLAISSYRGKARRMKGLGSQVDDVEVAIAADLQTAGAAAGLWESARALGGDRFRVLWLRYGEDMSIEDIAGALGRSRLAVRLLLHRARTSLRERMSRETGKEGEKRCCAA